MKLFLLIPFMAVLTGCSTVVPVKQEFPLAPSILMEKCPQLKQVDSDKGTMREMLKVVIENYATYYQCASKTHGWQDWYTEQKKIHDSVK